METYKQKQKQKNTEELALPTHLGFIMDGNRRWAKTRGLPTLEGHRKGFNAVTALIDACLDRGVQYVTIWAFSTENWDRSEEEIAYLMDLFEEMFNKYRKQLNKKNVKIQVAGRLSDFPEKVQESALLAIKETEKNNGLVLNIAFSYGGRAEIVDATKKIIAEGLSPKEITEEKFAEYIYEAGQPNIDMIVRTSGEQRLSGFMLWQSSYSEIYFMDRCWPDFNAEALDEVITEYQNRERRFGK